MQTISSGEKCDGGLAPAENRLALKGVKRIPWVRLRIERLKEKLDTAAKQKISIARTSW
jgi:hypothetical protein